MFAVLALFVTQQQVTVTATVMCSAYGTVAGRKLAVNKYLKVWINKQLLEIKHIKHSAIPQMFTT